MLGRRKRKEIVATDPTDPQKQQSQSSGRQGFKPMPSFGFFNSLSSQVPDHQAALAFVQSIIQDIDLWSEKKPFVVRFYQAAEDHPSWDNMEWFGEINSHKSEWLEFLQELKRYAETSQQHENVADTLLRQGYLVLTRLRSPKDRFWIDAINIQTNEHVQVTLLPTGQIHIGSSQEEQVPSWKRKEQAMEYLLTVIPPAIENSDWYVIEKAVNDVHKAYPSDWLKDFRTHFRKWTQLMSEVDVFVKSIHHNNQPLQAQQALKPLQPINQNHLASVLMQQGLLLEQKYGAGAYGMVLKAFHIPAQRHVAVKVIQNKQSDDDKSVIEQVMQDLFAKLDLAPLILDAMEVEARGKKIPVLVMQERPDNFERYLFDAYETKSSKDISKLNKWFITETNRIFDIMTKYHLVHADVKPDNMVVVQTPHLGPEQHHLQLLDFGLSYINHRSQEWPEWLSFSFSVLIGIEQNDSMNIKRGLIDLWKKMIKDNHVKSSLQQAAKRFEPDWQDPIDWLEEKTQTEDFVSIVEKLEDLKMKLNDVMFRELARFATHCNTLEENAQAIHIQSTERFLHDTVPANTKTLRNTIRKAKQCIIKIRTQNQSEYEDDPVPDMTRFLQIPPQVPAAELVPPAAAAVVKKKSKKNPRK